ncbi:MAG: ABC transporter permease subunit [Deltaproteobacteria bacterium]|nr:ABC transporter permease subunit [Deltaproteobacteria bacterium]
MLKSVVKTLLSMVLTLWAIAAVQWLGMSRTVRGLVGSLLPTPYVDAARTMGCGPVRLAVTHLVPNAQSTHHHMVRPPDSWQHQGGGLPVVPRARDPGP